MPAAVARGLLCSTRSRCIPSRRSHRRLRPRLGRACSRHPERHKTLGKGLHVCKLSSSGDPRSAMRVGAVRPRVAAEKAMAV